VADGHHEVQCAASSNGKVERSHRIDDEEFWQRESFTSFDDAAVAPEAWEGRYNHERFSIALRGHTPSEVLAANSALEKSPNSRQPGADLDELQQDWGETRQAMTLMSAKARTPQAPR
jgi:hypothetical protein